MNEVSTTQTKGTIAATANAGGSLGWNNGTSSNIFGGQDIIAQLFFNRTLSSQEQAAINSYGYSIQGNPTALANCLVEIGDSLSAGNAAINNQNYINQAIHGAATTITKQFRLYNYATGGMTAATMAGQISRYTSACSNAGVTNKLAVIMAGTNDILAGSSASTIASNVFSICSAMHSAGWKTVVMTIPNNSATNNSVIPTLNGLIEANYAANNCDRLVDNWANANIGAGSNTSNATYFNGDQEHLTATGYGIIGAALAVQVNSIF